MTRLRSQHTRLKIQESLSLSKQGTGQKEGINFKKEESMGRIHQWDHQFLAPKFVLLACVARKTIKSFHIVQEKSLSLSCWSE